MELSNKCPLGSWAVTCTVVVPAGVSSPRLVNININNHNNMIKGEDSVAIR